jgi:hypothetical protein
MMRSDGNCGTPVSVSGRMKHPMIAILWLAVLIAGCSGAAPSGTSGPLTDAELKLALVDRLGPLWFCDPDEYPVSRGDEALLAVQRFPEVQSDAEAFMAIIARLGIAPDADIDDRQKVDIYREWKGLNAIQLLPIGGDRFAFDILTRAPNTPEGGLRTNGEIDRSGTIRIREQVASGEPSCPICLGLGTLIATPDGPVPVERLGVGDLVWSPDATGRRRATPILEAGHTQAPRGHRVVELQLADGRHVSVSPGHPLADESLVGTLRVGDVVDGSRVASARLVDYVGSHTYDILPGGPTGAYWAGGILLQSTLGS